MLLKNFFFFFKNGYCKKNVKINYFDLPLIFDILPVKFNFINIK